MKIHFFNLNLKFYFINFIFIKFNFCFIQLEYNYFFKSIDYFYILNFSFKRIKIIPNYFIHRNFLFILIIFLFILGFLKYDLIKKIDIKFFTKKFYFFII
jgi:hypothetical protein